MTETEPGAGTPKRFPTGWPAATLVGIALALVALVGFYFGIYLALGANPTGSVLVMFGLAPLVGLLCGWFLGRRFGAAWLKWTLVGFGVAVVGQVIVAGVTSLFGNPGLAPRLALLAVLQQGLALPFSLVGAWLARRRSARS